MAEDQRPPTGPSAIPVSWKDMSSGTSIQGKPVNVVAPGNQEVAQYGRQMASAMCGNCAKFRLDAGQRAIEKEKFIGRLIHEEHWQIKHLGSGPETYGLCMDHDGSTIVSAFACCDRHKPANGRIGR